MKEKRFKVTCRACKKWVRYFDDESEAWRMALKHIEYYERRGSIKHAGKVELYEANK